MAMQLDTLSIINSQTILEKFCFMLLLVAVAFLIIFPPHDKWGEWKRSKQWAKYHSNDYQLSLHTLPIQ